MGWSDKQKIVCFESDDWGMVRTSSNEALNRLIDLGYPMDKSFYCKYDAFELTEDVQMLMNVLKDNVSISNRTPKFTLNNVVCNPDFDKIRLDNFEVYHRQVFCKTLDMYSGTDNLLKTYQKGIAEDIVNMQYHCTEHVNVNRWMTALNDKNNKAIREAFYLNMATVNTQLSSSCQKSFLDSFGGNHNEEFEKVEDVIDIGIKYFKEIWGFNSKSFIAPCYIWPSEVEQILLKNGVKYFQGMHSQHLVLKDGKIKIKYHFLGNKNKNNQLYLVRNCFFEPSSNLNKNWVDYCLGEIELAFKYGKPAIISSHRVNYISRLNVDNRDRSLKLLNELLRRINNKWPDVKFMTSDELGMHIESLRRE
jgi:hypothetical protein